VLAGMIAAILLGTGTVAYGAQGRGAGGGTLSDYYWAVRDASAGKSHAGGCYEGKECVCQFQKGDLRQTCVATCSRPPVYVACLDVEGPALPGRRRR